MSAQYLSNSDMPVNEDWTIISMWKRPLKRESNSELDSAKVQCLTIRNECPHIHIDHFYVAGYRAQPKHKPDGCVWNYVTIVAELFISDLTYPTLILSKLL